MRLVLVAMLAACTSSAQLPVARFANAPIVTAVDDRRDVPKPPAVRRNVLSLYHFDGSFFRLLTDRLALPAPRRALGVNALDEVPDSTWFTNRIGVRDLSLDEVRRGPATVGSPESHKPWTVKSSKVGGASVGFVIEDARGEKFLLKFDPIGFPETETATDAIVSRILWACGYNVPEDHVVYFRRDDLVLSPKAVVKDVFGKKSPLTRRELDARLAEIVVDGDGRIRGMASRMLDGTALGGHPQRGVRADDPNDRIPHELRRDLRGAKAIHAWVDSVDVKEDNTLDMWISDPGDPSRHYVKHYLIDFGKALGFMAQKHYNPRSGHEYAVDYSAVLANFLGLGLLERPWEKRIQPPLRGIGMYDVTFDPGTWKPNTPAYLPFRLADRIDAFWATKVMIRFTREQLRAIVETGRLTDPRAVDYLVDTLAARQRATAAYWFARVSPLDRFAVERSELCFDDLAIGHGLATPLATHHWVTVYDQAGRDRTGRDSSLRVELRSSGARSCTPFAIADGYAIVRVEMRRPSGRTVVFVHVARDRRTSELRVVGVWRS